MDFPTIDIQTPLATPLTGGLYDAASVQDVTDGRHLGGLSLEPSNTGTSGLWPAEGATEDTPPKEGPRPDRTDFKATVIWAADNVKTVAASEDGVQARTAHILKLLEPVRVEEFVAEQLKAIKAEAAAASLEDQLGKIEDELGKYGRPGIVHASRALLPAMSKFIVRQGQALFTPGGHRWAFGGGYSALGTDLVATGPAVVVRGPVVYSNATNARINQFDGVAERIVAVGWEGPAIRVPATAQA